MLRLLDIAINGKHEVREAYRRILFDPSLHTAHPCSKRPCHYHEHDEEHPACSSKHGNSTLLDCVMRKPDPEVSG